MTVERISFPDEAYRLFLALSGRQQAAILTIMDAMIAHDTEAVRNEIRAIYGEAIA